MTSFVQNPIEWSAIRWTGSNLAAVAAAARAAGGDVFSDSSGTLVVFSHVDMAAGETDVLGWLTGSHPWLMYRTDVPWGDRTTVRMAIAGDDDGAPVGWTTAG